MMMRRRRRKRRFEVEKDLGAPKLE